MAKSIDLLNSNQKPTIEYIRDNHTTSEDWYWLSILLDKIKELETEIEHNF